MKLISFGKAGKERPGVVCDGNTILDIQLASSNKIPSIRKLLELGDEGLKQVRTWMEATSSNEWRLPGEGIRLGPPLTNSSKIVCVGLNYHSHAKEQKAKLPKNPLLFSKSSTSVIGNGDSILYPVEEEHVDYEGELAFVIGKPAFRTRPEDWRDYVAGITIVNDVSARDAQFGDRKWFRGKSFDTFCPMGPFLVTLEDIPDPHNLSIQSKLNGELRQKGHTSDLIFNIGDILSFASKNITFLPGDIISTGTPSGVGIFFDPPKCMNIGDVIEVTLEGVGTLTNTVTKRREELPSLYPCP